jgi:hypothetical protein
MLESTSYSTGYIVVLKFAVSDGRIYICGACCCDWRVEAKYAPTCLVTSPSAYKGLGSCVIRLSVTTEYLTVSNIMKNNWKDTVVTNLKYYFVVT